MQVVHTKYKALKGLEKREFVEKKLYFCHQEDPEELLRLAKSPRVTNNRRRRQKHHSVIIESKSVFQQSLKQ